MLLGNTTKLYVVCVLIIRTVFIHPWLFVLALSMKFRRSALLRVVAIFVSGSVVGWAAHDSALGRTANDRFEERDHLRFLSADFKPAIPWDNNWDK